MALLVLYFMLMTIAIYRAQSGKHVNFTLTSQNNKKKKTTHNAYNRCLINNKVNGFILFYILSKI